MTGELRPSSFGQAELLERELAAFAGELHDGLLQYVIAAQMVCQRWRLRSAATQQEIPEELPLLEEYLRQAIHEGRMLLDGTRPIDWQHQSLAAELQRLVERFQSQSGIAVQLDCAGMLDPRYAPPDAAESQQLFRIVQELLNNIRRHSHARTAAIRFSVADEQHQLYVQDDGVGFDPTAVPEGHFGLSNLSRRATLLGGSCHIDGRPGQGACVTVTWPARGPNTRFGICAEG